MNIIAAYFARARRLDNLSYEIWACELAITHAGRFPNAYVYSQRKERAVKVEEYNRLKFFWMLRK